MIQILESDMGKGSRPRPMQISDEEYDLRWAVGSGELDMTPDEFDKRVAEIRKRTGKPKLHTGRGW